jgi:dipeptidyl aminopeptidase/acylaminoacyl peptidase
MKRAHQYLLFVLLFGASLAFGLRYFANDSQKTSSDALSLSSRSKNIPYSIESFRLRDYLPSTIKQVRVVQETPAFRSSVVSYQSDGLTLYALMNVPTSPEPLGGYPVVIVNHGYIDPAIYTTERSYANTSAYFAQNGFLVLKPDYRDHDKSEGEARKFFSRMDYAIDVAHLIASIPSLPQANPQKIFMYGHSMGGDITLRLTEMSHRITAATLWAPAVTTFPESHLYFTRRNSAGEVLKSQQELDSTLSSSDYSAVSVLENLDYVTTPLIIHHGTHDESVPYSWGAELYNLLMNQGKSVTLYTYEGDNHDIAGNWSTALSRDVAFFRSFLD